MKPLRLLLPVLFTACTTGVADELADEADDHFTTGRADGFGVDEESTTAIGVLQIVNQVSFEELDLSEHVGLDVRAVEGIVAARVESPFTTLAELDAIPWVGPIALEKLVAYHERVLDEAHARLAGEMARIAEFFIRRFPFYENPDDQLRSGTFPIVPGGGKVVQRSQHVFRNNVLVDAVEVWVYDEEDRLACTGNVLLGRQGHGLWRCFARDGKLVAAGTFFEGDSAGPWLAFDARMNEIGRYGYRSKQPVLDVAAPTSDDILVDTLPSEVVSHVVPLAARTTLTHEFWDHAVEDGAGYHAREYVHGERHVVAAREPVFAFAVESQVVRTTGDRNASGLRHGNWTFTNGPGRGWKLAVGYFNGVANDWKLFVRDFAILEGTFRTDGGGYDPCIAMRWAECPLLDPAR